EATLSKEIAAWERAPERRVGAHRVDIHRGPWAREAQPRLSEPRYPPHRGGGLNPSELLRRGTSSGGCRGTTRPTTRRQQRTRPRKARAEHVEDYRRPLSVSPKNATTPLAFNVRATNRNCALRSTNGTTPCHTLAVNSSAPTIHNGRLTCSHSR